MAAVRIALMVAIILIHTNLMSPVQCSIGTLAAAFKDAFSRFVAGDNIACRAAFWRGILGMGVVYIVARPIRERIVHQGVFGFRDTYMQAIHAPVQGTFKGGFAPIVPYALVCSLVAVDEQDRRLCLRDGWRIRT